MTETIETTPIRCWVRPTPGITVTDPITRQPLPVHGGPVAWDSFWQRRLDDGDIEMTTEKAVEAAAAKTAKADSDKGDTK